MAQDHFMDMKDISESFWILGWRCLNCGEVLDPCIKARRALKGELKLSKRRAA
jgi:hypothetical protein